MLFPAKRVLKGERNMEEAFWSTQVQGPLTLDLSREIRFREDRKDLWLNLLRLTKGMTVVDIGCGPGTLTRKLAKWLGPESKIIGVDKDPKFIEYARFKGHQLGLKNVEYIQANALDLPFDDNSVDACTSHTVIEHVPNREFLLEQKRICDSGGVISVMSVRTNHSIHTKAESRSETDREELLWAPITKAWKENDRANNVGKYELKPMGFPLLLEEAGLGEIEIDAMAIPVAIDDARNTLEDKIDIIQAEYHQSLEALEIGLRLLNEPMPQRDISEIRDLIEERALKRVEKIRQGVRIWDFGIYMVLICSGKKA
jgi:ubiquinone/menaquinone biosynthesis C-methylase UbiE